MRSQRPPNLCSPKDKEIWVLLDDLSGEPRNMPAVLKNRPLHDYDSALALFSSSGWGQLGLASAEASGPGRRRPSVDPELSAACQRPKVMVGSCGIFPRATRALQKQGSRSPAPTRKDG